jgi:hypothetical protein
MLDGSTPAPRFFVHHVVAALRVGFAFLTTFSLSARDRRHHPPRPRPRRPPRRRSRRHRAYESGTEGGPPRHFPDSRF